jgi:hypothetical protein
MKAFNYFSSSPHRLDRTSGGSAGDAAKVPVRVIYRGRSALNPEALVDLYDACAEFIRRCDCGEVRSRRSYAQMKAAVEKAERVRV